MTLIVGAVYDRAFFPKQKTRGNTPRLQGILFGVVCFISFSSVSFSQSIADAARKERERQKETHSTLTFSGVAATTTVTTSSAVSQPSIPQSFELKDNNGHDEKYWRQRFQLARDTLKRAEERAQILDEQVKKLNTELLTRSDIYNRENRLGPEITKAQSQLEDARKDADLAKQKLSDLEDELHKAGGPAGWAR